MQSPLHRHLFLHYGNLLISAIGLVLLALAAWLQPQLLPPLLWAGLPIYLGVLLPRWVGRRERQRRAAAVREAAVLLEAEGVAVDYTYLPEETE